MVFWEEDVHIPLSTFHFHLHLNILILYPQSNSRFSFVSFWTNLFASASVNYFVKIFSGRWKCAIVRWSWTIFMIAFPCNGKVIREILPSFLLEINRWPERSSASNKELFTIGGASRRCISIVYIYIELSARAMCLDNCSFTTCCAVYSFFTFISPMRDFFWSATITSAFRIVKDLRSSSKRRWSVEN